MLRDVSHQDISVTILGHKISMPICVSPTAYQAMAHPDGELATVRGKLSFLAHLTLLYNYPLPRRALLESPETTFRALLWAR